MATSGEFNISTTSTNTISGKITWSESNVNVNNNTSDLTVTLMYYKPDGQYVTQGSGYFQITVDGQSYEDNHYTRILQGWTTALSHTFTITHSADGTKSASIVLNHGYISGTTGLSASSGSGTATLTTIPRASTVSCANGNFGGAVTATVTRASSSFTHTLKFSIGSSYSETKTGVGTSLSYTVPASWAASIPAGTSTTMTVTCTTYNGSTQIGSATSTTCTISVPSSWAASASISASLGGTKGDSNQVLKGLTTVTLTCTGTATTGSSISSYKWSGGSTATTASITCSTAAVGSTTYTCTVTDRRGKTASKSYTVTVVDPKSTISGATTGTFGSNYALTISRINSSFTHTVVFYINSSYTSGNRTGKTTSDTYTIPASWGAAIPSATSTTVHITCTTYNGSTSLGSVSKDITVSIPSSWVPTVSITKSYADRGSQNQILAGTTTLTVTASGSASSGATVSSYSWSGGYVSGTGASKTHKPASAGTYTYTVTITDSRNKTASATVTETFQNPSSTFTCANSVNFGAALDVSIARLKASYTHIVRYYISSSYTHDENDGGHASTSYTIPANWAACVPTTSSATMTVTCYTYNGSTQIGSTSKSVTVNVPSSWLPAIGSISATGVSTFNSQYLKGESKATIAVSSVTASTGANISKYKYAGNNISTSETASTATSNSRTTSLLTSVGTNTYTVTVTDSRGRTASKTVSIEVKDYAKPTIRLTVGRYDDQGNPDNFGEYGKMTLTGSFTNVTGNTWTLVCKQKPKTSSTYVTVNTWSNQNNAVNRGSDLFLADVDKTYDCYAIITDAVGYSAEVVIAMSTGRAIQDIYKDRAVAYFSTASSDLLTYFNNPDTLFVSNAQTNAINGYTVIPADEYTDGFTNGWFNLNALSTAATLGKPQRTIKTTGVDLNNCYEVGVYVCPSSATASSLVHAPTGEAFRMFVTTIADTAYKPSTYLYRNQIVVGLTGRIFYRSGSSSTGVSGLTWDDWKTMATIQNDLYPTTVASEANMSTAASQGFFKPVSNPNASFTLGGETFPQWSRGWVMNYSSNDASFIAGTTKGVFFSFKNGSTWTSKPLYPILKGYSSKHSSVSAVNRCQVFTFGDLVIGSIHVSMTSGQSIGTGTALITLSIPRNFGYTMDVSAISGNTSGVTPYPLYCNGGTKNICMNKSLTAGTSQSLLFNFIGVMAV